MELKVKVDQSHCNYRLSLNLSELGWKVIFRDPGRVSRGISGNQETVLGVFERNSLPIPDIVATMDSSLLLIEVDVNPWSNKQSFDSYKSNCKLIVSELIKGNVLDGSVNTLLLGFCKVGTIKNISELQNALLVNLIASFEDPLKPSLFWSFENVVTF